MLRERNAVYLGHNPNPATISRSIPEGGTGQINEMETIGLYFYNARFYDPLLGRFVSPDTLIPQPSSPQAWDRYAYARNNPLRYTDPSGHETCDLDGSCGYRRRLNYNIIRRYEFRVQYGIDLIGNWSQTGFDIFSNSITVLDRKLGGEKGSAVRKIYGPDYHNNRTAFVLNENMGKVCDASNSTISCGLNSNYKFFDRLIIHELGHRFNAIYVNNHPGANDSPYSLLWDASLNDKADNHISGKNSNGTFERTLLGFKSGYQPDVMHGLEFADWNANDFWGTARNEDWADMFMNWVFNSFSNNNSGEVRFQWMDSTIKTVLTRW